MQIKATHLTTVVGAAHKSEHSAKHGAILVKKGKVIAVTNNKYCSKIRLGHFHSDRVRVNNNGDLVNSEPCELCKKILITMGVKKVYHS